MRGGQRPTWRPEREARGSALGVQSREGSYVFAGAFLLSTPVLRDCRVASLLAMTTFLYSALSFSLCSYRYSGDPFGTSCHCLAAARSRRGSDMPPACHSLPRRRFATPQAPPAALLSVPAAHIFDRLNDFSHIPRLQSISRRLSRSASPSRGGYTRCRSWRSSRCGRRRARTPCPRPYRA